MKGSKAPKGGKGHSKKHPGFDNVAGGMAKKQGVPVAEAKAELAASSRNASPAAKKANPRLNKVGGAKAPPKGAKGGAKKH